jgi:hypothetical protein
MDDKVFTYQEFLHHLPDLCERFDVSVIQLTKEQAEESGDINNSWMAGKQLMMGVYDNDEFKLISLFHELGHTVEPVWLRERLDSDYFKEPNAELEILEPYKYFIERQAWIEGMRIAKDIYNITFSREAIQYAKKCLATYTTITKNCGR